MHRIAATPGGYNPEAEGVIFIEQTPAPLVFLTAADTEIQTLAAALPHLPSEFPALRCANLLQLQQELSIDTYAETVLTEANAIVLRLLGGRSYWSYGLEVVKEVAAETGAALWILPGDDRPDLNLTSHSTVSLQKCDRLWQYFVEGGVENYRLALEFISDCCWETSYQPALPQKVPRIGLLFQSSVNSHPRLMTEEESASTPLSVQGRALRLRSAYRGERFDSAQRTGEKGRKGKARASF